MSTARLLQVSGVVVPVAPPSALYRPVAISEAGELPNFPTDANPVMWSWARSSGMMLHEALQTLGTNDVLVLPEDSQPYEVDSSGGFVNDTTRYYEMARTKGRGIVGLGPGAIVQPSASSFSAPRQTGSAGTQERVIQSFVNNSYYGNFEMRGRDFGGIAYNALSHEGSGSVWENLYLTGAHRGFANEPPGETGGIVGHSGTNQAINNCEVDCRDPANGNRVGTSPYMFNIQSNVTVTDFYGHHAVAGMPTFYAVNGGQTLRVRSEHNGSGGGTLGGSALNHELCKGIVTHTESTLICDWHNPSNSGLHASIGSNNGVSVKLSFVRATIDAGPKPGWLAVQGFDGAYQPVSQLDSDITATNPDGTVLPVQVYH